MGKQEGDDADRGSINTRGCESQAGGDRSGAVSASLLHVVQEQIERSLGRAA